VWLSNKVASQDLAPFSEKVENHWFNEVESHVNSVCGQTMC